jgi:8-oxo-dGTP pyrophosphatase MutT (NUDIX family)
MENTINEEGKWEIVSTEYLVRRPWLTARRDVVRLPDGRINPEYYVLEYPDWVNVIAITREGQIVMERQYRHGLGNTCFELPCGVIEEGETPLEAAKRELLEETGYAGGSWQEWMTLSPNPSTSNNLTHSFLAVGVEKVSDQHLDATEDISVYLLDSAYVRELLVNNQILQALMAAPLWKFFSSERDC